MGFRFHKSIKLFPGVRLNLSKSGISTTIGRPGANVNIRGRRLRGTVGLPGSGLSYSREATIGGAEAGDAAPTRKTLGSRLIARLLGRA